MSSPRLPSVRDIPVPEPRVGLCSACRHALVQESARGQRFWRCQLAQIDPAYRRYPPLPVTECPGFERGAGGDGADADRVGRDRR